ncbi:bacillithiol system redox-active protein YtxJ [Peribacillus frigoritolerans]|uniref:bacillithiol system redox-active protein YtxJ n=1 Tax=Peribacillus frigoritolerans TaxID=450367 RepID=UPI0025A19B30|nr:bacillithiol system redox-active protein YtxJ [Peribacillus frigoritolerans]MDM5306854.1 bacillithiol system redox-active protein YtxJ [Peribacillus frigoritolerans]
MKWKEITTLEEWDDILEKSTKRGQVILKHSTTCPVSSNALKEYEHYLEGSPKNNVDFIIVKVIESRAVSNKIAEDLIVKHESPQVIFVKDKSKYWTASHWSVTTEHMTAELN